MSNLDDFLQKANDRQVKGHFSIKELSWIDTFIKENNIKEGETALPNRFIYALYCLQERPGIKPRKFGNLFKTFFKHRKAGNYIYYRLDPTPFNIPAHYSFWRELTYKKFNYKKTKFHNIKSTPDGWMVYLDFPQGRQIYGFFGAENKAARMADKLAYYFYGDTYKKFNFQDGKYEEDEVLLQLLRQGKSRSNEPEKTEETI